MKKKLYVIIGLVLFFGIFGPVLIPDAKADTHTAASCSYADVQATVNAASSGDTVTVPSGNCTWSTQLTITKGIILKGAGIGNTVITSGINDAYNTFVISYEPSNPTLNEPFELSGFTLDGRATSGMFYASGGGSVITKLKIHDNKFINGKSRAFSTSGLEFGVVYANQFQDNNIDLAFGGVESAGWNYNPNPYGTADYLYVEDNIFTYTGVREGFIIDSGHGGRYAVRHNTITNYTGGDVFDMHGNMDPYPANRGMVAVEIYNNILTNKCTSYQYNRFFAHRGGKAVIANNVSTSLTSPNGNCLDPSSHAGIGVTEEDEWQLHILNNPPGYDTVNNSFYWNNKSTIGSTTRDMDVYIYDNGNGSVAAKYVSENVNFWRPSSGLDVNKPVACSDNAYYGAADTGKLYKCHPANTWTLQYTPYTYPHPLRGGAQPSVLYGDVSVDGTISAYDASLAAQYAVGLITLTQSQLTAADVSGDGTVSAYDASLIAQKAVGLITKFPVEGG